MSPTGARPRHFSAHRFSVEVEIHGLVEAIFTEVSGLSSEIEEFTYMEGGVNDMVHCFPVRVKYPHITLKRGMTTGSGLWTWYQNTTGALGNAEGCRIRRKNITIFLRAPNGRAIYKWNLRNAFPVKWTGPELKSDSTSVAIEALEIAHEGMTVVP